MDALGLGWHSEEDWRGKFVHSRARPRPGRLVGSLAAEILAAGREHTDDRDILSSSPWHFGCGRSFSETDSKPSLASTQAGLGGFPQPPLPCLRRLLTR